MCTYFWRIITKTRFCEVHLTFKQQLHQLARSSHRLDPKFNNNHRMVWGTTYHLKNDANMWNYHHRNTPNNCRDDSYLRHPAGAGSTIYLEHSMRHACTHTHTHTHTHTQTLRSICCWFPS